MPSLTGQNQEYLIKAIKAYRDGQRKNAMMRTATKNLKNSAIQNLSAYFATQKPKKVVGTDRASAAFDPLGDGAKIAASCNGCHGKNGNSTNKGIPSLSRLHPDYLSAAIKAYQDGTRQHETMKSLVALLSDMDIENISLYYATQEPTASTNSKAGKPEQAEELASSCNGCHGDNGNSTDPEVPSIAGQDAQYLSTAIAHYANGSRENETMANAVKELSKEQISDVSAYYAGQTPVKPEGIVMPLPPEELAQKCNRCHGENGFSEDPAKPRLAGQIQAYLEKALHDYHDGNRESTTMHAMAAVLRLSEIKAITAYYSSQQ
jgi:cytochrome c553